MDRNTNVHPRIGEDETISDAGDCFCRNPRMLRTGRIKFFCRFIFDMGENRLRMNINFL